MHPYSISKLTQSKVSEYIKIFFKIKHKRRQTHILTRKGCQFPQLNNVYVIPLVLGKRNWGIVNNKIQKLRNFPVKTYLFSLNHNITHTHMHAHTQNPTYLPTFELNRFVHKI